MIQSVQQKYDISRFFDASVRIRVSHTFLWYRLNLISRDPRYSVQKEEFRRELSAFSLFPDFLVCYSMLLHEIALYPFTFSPLFSSAYHFMSMSLSHVTLVIPRNVLWSVKRIQTSRQSRFVIPFAVVSVNVCGLVLWMTFITVIVVVCRREKLRQDLCNYHKPFQWTDKNTNENRKGWWKRKISLRDVRSLSVSDSSKDSYRLRTEKVPDSWDIECLDTRVSLADRHA